MNSFEWGVWWFTLALINTGLAQAKHRDALLTFVLSLVLGPLATLITVLPRPRQRNSARTGSNEVVADRPGE